MKDLKGQTLGRYQIIERLGRGGMADVYKGYQPQLDRYVAIKLMHEHLAEDAQFISRFQREAKSVAALRHPHIVQVFDFDTQDNMSFMVMEYIEGGRTLKEVLTEASESGQRIPPAQALEIMAKLADALDYAHKAGMVHRDIKPSNVLVSDLNHPVLSDFGIARLIGQTGLTASGAMIGTPAYMSPEQGRGEVADERSDIYALGIILYEMLTGHPPYDADTPYAVILKHINAPLITPRTSVPDLPESAERVVLKSLAKAAEERYQTAGEMKRALLAAALELSTDTTPTSDVTPASGLRAPSSTMVGTPLEEDRTLPMSAGHGSAATVAEPVLSPSAKPSRGLPLPLLIGGGLLAALICGAIVIGALAAMRNNQATVADEETNEPSAEVPTGEPSTEVTAVPDEVIVDEEASPEVQDLLDQAHDQWDVGETDQALELFAQALELAPDNIDALTSTSLLYMRRDEAEPALEFLERAEAISPDDGFVSYARGMFHWTMGDYYDSDLAIDAFTRSIADCSDPWVCPDAYYQLAYLQAWHKADFDAALESITQAIERQEDPQTQAGYLDQSAHIRFYGKDDLEGAVAALEQAYTLDEGSWHMNTAANFIAQTGDYTRARALYERLLTDQAGEPVFLIGTAYMDYLNGDLDTATASTERALTFDPEMYGARYMKGLLLLESGDAEAAFTELEAASQLNLDDQGYWLYEFPFFTVEWAHNINYDLARAVYALGDTDDALTYLDEAIAEHSGWPQPYMLKGQIYQDAGDLASARDQYVLALEVTSEDDVELRTEIEQRLADLTSTP